MNLAEISNLRLLSQQIAEAKFKSAKEIVGWMGAMQAQDYSMAKWAIGIRLADSTVHLIESAIDKGQIIRTHLLRPTWHFVSSDDIFWMLALTAPQIKAILKTRDKALELNEKIYGKSNAIIEQALNRGRHLTREALVAELELANIPTDNNRASHLLLRAEIDGITGSGKSENNKQTYALLSERVPKGKTLNKEEALAKLAERYFTSHGPATLRDFIWWSGLSATDSKHALEMVKSHFVSETVGKQTYWLTNSFTLPTPGINLVYLLPAYDEFVISYKDRTVSMPVKNHIRAISSNGIFRPTIVINGQVSGLWKRTIKKERVIVEIELFQSVDNVMTSLIEKSINHFVKFVNKEMEFVTRLK